MDKLTNMILEFGALALLGIVVAAIVIAGVTWVAVSKRVGPDKGFKVLFQWVCGLVVFLSMAFFVGVGVLVVQDSGTGRGGNMPIPAGIGLQEAPEAAAGE